MFYKFTENKYIKIIPLNIKEYLTPLALAILFINNGSCLDKGARIAFNCFTFEEVNFLCKILKIKYNIIATPNKYGKNRGYIIYINSNSMKLFTDTIKPYLLPSLYYKLKSNK
jgi:hypothetical protein